MRLLYMLGSTGGVVGGLEKHVLELAEDMAAAGHRVLVVADPVYLPVCRGSIEMAPLPMSGLVARWRLPSRLASIIHDFRPDIVHAHAGKAAALLASVLPQFPDRSWHAVATAHGLKRRYRGFAAMDGVVAVSAGLKAGLPANTLIIPSGVRTPVPRLAVMAALREQGRDWPRPWVIAVGRLVPVKGFDILLEAWRLAGSGSLVILGEGRQREVLEARCRSQGMVNVHLLGESREVPEWLALADLFVLSSLREGGPYVLVEALQAGLPVVSTAVGLAPRLLASEHLIPPGNAEALAAGLRKALEDPEAAAHQAALAREKVSAEFCQQVMLDKLLQLYVELRSKGSTRATSAS